uniref:Uncharacterized protein n=1 Tax=Arundo donax TaxID=35708 RepID=A0A0A9DEM5_ARUDO
MSLTEAKYKLEMVIKANLIQTLHNTRHRTTIWIILEMHKKRHTFS